VVSVAGVRRRASSGWPITGAGTPSCLWAWVWALHERGAFVAEQEPSDEQFTEDDSWEAPMSADGARSVARELMRRVDDGLPSARGQPLFVTLIGTGEGASSEQR
jgi:hypothetical protein